MAKRISDEKVLMERVIKMLPKGVPAEAIESVECDPYNGGEYGDRHSYWVNLAAGWKSPDDWCHVIHENNLKELAVMVGGVEEWSDDPALEDEIEEPKEIEEADLDSIYKIEDTESKFEIIKVSESKAPWNSKDLDKEYKGVISGLACGWNFEVTKDGKIDYLSANWFEGTPEQLAKTYHYDDADAMFRWNGWELTGRAVFRGYAVEYYVKEEREWCVFPLTDAEVEEHIKSRHHKWHEYHISDMKWGAYDGME